MIQFQVSSAGIVINDLKKQIEKFTDDWTDDLLENLQSKRKATPGSGRTPYKNGNASDGWEKDGNTLRNKVPYIGRLEHGHSTQAPEGFVQQAINKTIRKTSRSKK